MDAAVNSEAEPQTDKRGLRLASGYIVLPGRTTPPRKGRVAGAPVRPGSRLDGTNLTQTVDISGRQGS